MSARKLRYGFIGAGDISRAHLRHLAGREDVELVALADVDVDAMQRRSKRYGVAEHYTDYRQMLRDSKLDAVSVCTPNRLHSQHTRDALEAGVAVLCEKPMSATVAEAEDMLDAQKATNGSW